MYFPSKLRNGFEKLNEEALIQKGGNSELQRQMREKEQEIKMKERQLSQLNRRISKCQAISTASITNF
jgi:predicted RNase H-like nuclease (RuvC/YqgF family)